MSQREAFEAADQRLFEIDDSLYCPSDNRDYFDTAIQCRWEIWQAAIQHARDVAVKTCEEEKVEVAVNNGKYSDGDVGYNTACTHCADAIKEALK